MKDAMDHKNYQKLVNRFTSFVSFASQKILKAKEQCASKNIVFFVGMSNL